MQFNIVVFVVILLVRCLASRRLGSVSVSVFERKFNGYRNSIISEIERYVYNANCSRFKEIHTAYEMFDKVDIKLLRKIPVNILGLNVYIIVRL